MHLFTIECLVRQAKTQGVDLNADLAVYAQFSNAKELGLKMVETGVVDDVFFVNPYYKTGIKNGLRYFASYVFSRKRVEKGFLDRVPGMVGRQYINLFIPFPSKFALDLHDFVAPLSDVFLFDDGMWTYSGKVFSHVAFASQMNKQCDSRKRLMSSVLNFLAQNHYSMRVKGVYCYHPESLLFELSPKIQHKPISLPDDVFDTAFFSVYMSREKRIALSKVVFLGTVEKEIIACESLQTDLFHKLKNEFGDSFTFKPHPRDCNMEIWRSKGVIIDEGKDLWELRCLQGDIDESTVLLGYGSTALWTPKMLFGLEPYVISLHRLAKSNTTNFEETDQIFTHMRDVYVNSERVYFPSTKNEFYECINEIKKHL